MPVRTNAGGGGGIDPDELTATTGDVLKGKIAGVNGCDEPEAGTLELTGDAAESHVIAGKTFYNTDAKTKKTGNVVNRGAPSQSLNAGESYDIASGYYTGGKVAANSLASQTAATATAAQILSGQTAWVNGSRVTGTIGSKGAATYTPGTSAQTIAAGQYLSGAQTIAARPAGWYDSATQQTVFNYGSYGVAANLGAYYTSSSGVWIVDSTRPVTFSTNSGMYMGGYDSIRRAVFRQSFPLFWQYMRITYRAGILPTSIYVYVLNAATKAVIGYVQFSATSTTAATTRIIDLSSTVSQATGGWYLGIHYSNSCGNYGILSIALSPTSSF